MYLVLAFLKSGLCSNDEEGDEGTALAVDVGEEAGGLAVRRKGGEGAGGGEGGGVADGEDGDEDDGVENGWEGWFAKSQGQSFTVITHSHRHLLKHSPRIPAS